MLLSIQHRTELAYTARISETVMEVRMTPRTDAHQTLRGSRIAVGPSAPLLELDDWLGNRVHQFSIVPFHDRVVILAESAVDTHRTPVPYRRLEESAPVSIVDHRLRDFLAFGGYVTDDPRLGELAAALALNAGGSVGTIVEGVATRLRDRLEYRKGQTTSATKLAGVLDAGGGVCQDLAHVAIALLRHSGIPARYVSGYWHRDGGGELETHAWCEAWSPSAGWTSVDPTHRGPAGDGHVAVGLGRDYGDVPPNRGVFRGDADEAIAASVMMTAVDALPAGLLAPRGVGVEVPSYGDGPALHREQLDYQQEQQQQ